VPEEIDLSAEEEAALERAWEKIEAEEKPKETDPEEPADD
jgi:hypothetical protein